MRVTQAADYDEPRDSLSRDWIERLREWGMIPLLIPNGLDDPAAYCASFGPHILVLTGGGDPGGPPERDATERHLLDGAARSKLPVLGVCRGMQVINLYFGGTLETVEGHVACQHPVSICGGWQDYFSPTADVNSFHNLAITKGGLGRELQATAFDPDGRIEGFRHQTLPLAGVMWHPERGAPEDGNRRLMDALAALKPAL